MESLLNKTGAGASSETGTRQSSERTQSGFVPTPTGAYTIPESQASDEIELSLILPTFKEAHNISAVLEVVTATLRHVPGLRFEIIVVDDASPDATAQLALDKSTHLPEVRVIRRENENGLATAVIRGWQVARGEILAVMDADLQHPSEVLHDLVMEMRAGVDLAVASRHVENGGVSDWSLARHMISRTAQLIGLVLLPEVIGRVADPMSGYFMLRRRAIAGKALNPTGYKILIEVVARGEIGRISEVGYIFRERQEGQSKVSPTIYLQYLQHLLRLRAAMLQRSRFVRFCLVGLSGVVVDMALLYLLGDPQMLGWGLTRSKILAAEAAILNNFLWNDAWTFADRVRHQRLASQKFHRFLKFNAICFIGLVLNVILLNIQFNLFGMNRYVANGTSILAATAWNYLINKRLSWRTARVSLREEPAASLLSLSDELNAPHGQDHHAQ
jgi:dolichol-phosphate mannosyltransferase